MWIQSVRYGQTSFQTVSKKSKYFETEDSGGSKGGGRGTRPPGLKFLYFHAVFGKKLAK